MYHISQKSSLADQTGKQQINESLVRRWTATPHSALLSVGTEAMPSTKCTVEETGTMVCVLGCRLVTEDGGKENVRGAARAPW